MSVAEASRDRPDPNRQADHGPFDIIGDIHGCHAELVSLLGKLGYEVAPDGHQVTPPPGRTAVFVGDYVDRGPDTPGVLKLVMAMTAAGTAICVPGNHDLKVVHILQGHKMELTHGLVESMQQLAQESAEFRDAACEFLDSLGSHYVLDGGRLVVAHAGMKQDFQGHTFIGVRSFAVFGERSEEHDEFGLRVRPKWARNYAGDATVVFGHTPVPEPVWLNNTVNIDTGCVFGGKLTALRWPERELVSVPAQRRYYRPARPFLPELD